MDMFDIRPMRGSLSLASLSILPVPSFQRHIINE